MSNFLDIQDSGKTKVHDYGFAYMSPKEFRGYAAGNEHVRVIGTTRLKKISENKMNDVDTYLRGGHSKPIFFRMTKPRKGLCRGYISVGDDKFVAYHWFSFISLVPWILFLFAVLALCFVLGNDSNGKIELADFVPIDLSNDTSTAEIKYYDFQTQGSYEVSEENPKFKVWNPETNSRVFQYSIYIDGELFTQTKGITPGNMIELDCHSLLDKKGDHDLVLDLSVLDENTGEVVGQAQRNAVLTVR